MPLGVREVLLVVRAQNLGSGVLRNLAGDFNNLEGAARRAAQQQMQTGTSLMAVGTAIGAVGAAGLVFLGKATQQAVEYNRQVALTKTQMYGVKATFQQVSQAGLDVARNIAVPLDQIQGGLYDIFSSMDVNLNQAKFLLKNFSKEAVAGQVDLSTAERATIGILNSYRMKVQDVTKVQDIMFNLVKFGVGTYEDFANVIGRVTGPAVRQNQTFEQTAALMAFVTRNGLSAANAASSVGRALDAIGKSRDKIQSIGATVEDALGMKTAHKLGFTHDQMIKVTTAAGKMLPINVIMTNLGRSLGKLNPTQLNDVLTTMFKGTGGTIQAMRFFDIAIHNFGQLNKMVQNMGKSKGALKAAYDIMANTPAAKIQLLKNNFKAFMIVLGNELLPIVKVVADALAHFFKLLGTLPKPVIQVIAIILGVTSVLLVLTGVIMVVVGAWLVFNALLAVTDVELLPIAVTIGLVIAAIVALAVAAYFIVKYWQPISKWFHDMWFAMWRWIDHIWQNIAGSIDKAWKSIQNIFNTIMKWISGNFDQWWKTHGESVKAIWKSTWGAVTDIFRMAWDVIIGALKVVLAIFTTAAKVGWQEVVFFFKTGWDVIKGIFRIAWAVILAGFKIWWAAVAAVAKIMWASIKAIFKIAWDTIVVIFDIFLDVIRGHWKTLWIDVKNYGIQVWNAIKGFLQVAWNALKGLAFTIWHAIAQLFFSIWHSIYDTTQSVWHNITSFLSRVWDGIKTGARNTVNGLGQIWRGIENIFKVPINFVIGTVYDNGIAKLWNTVMNAIGLKRFDLPHIATLAKGGRLPGFGGGDRLPALLEAGETVIDKHKSRQYGWLFRMMGVPGYSAGGTVPGPGAAVARFGTSVNPSGPALGPLGGIIHVAGAVAKMTAAALTGNQTAFSNALISAFPGMKGTGGALASMIATLPTALAHKIISGLWSTIAGSGGGGNYKYKPGAGVQQWRGLVDRALSMEGLSKAFDDRVLYQMMTESGGNPRAINLTDINAQHGDPSRGLMQVIMSTFRAYHWPGTSWDIYNPLANIAAAINYAKHTYGPQLGNQYGGIGSGHGYAKGTDGAAAGWAWVGENGPELVYFHGGETVVPGKGRGYAKGTKVAKIGKAEINSGISIFTTYVQSGLLTLAKIQSEQTVFLRTIARYYSGNALHWRQAMVQRQTTAMENASKQLTTLQNQAKAAQSYAASVTSNLQGYAALSNVMPTAGMSAVDQSNQILTGIKGKLSNLRKFASVLVQLRKKGVSPAIIQQIVDMGPDDGLTFANALLNGPLVNLQELNTYQKQISTVTGQVGKSAAAAVYGQAAVDGFKAREKQLTTIMRQLGKELGVEAAHWMHVPSSKLPKGYASGTNYASPGWAWVGERGPELVRFRGGEQVKPAGMTQTINVYTQEINPRRHAAELGWELARRSALCLQC